MIPSVPTRLDALAATADKLLAKLDKLPMERLAAELETTLTALRELVTGPELMREDPDGARVRHADLDGVCPYGVGELTIDGRGNIYVNSINFDFAGFEAVMASGRSPGNIALVTPDHEVREVADGLAFPNGMVVTPDNRTLIVAESFARQLTAFDIADDGSLSNRRTWRP